MAPRKCVGIYLVNGERMQCIFSINPETPRRPAHGSFDGRCVWCNPQELRRRCENQRLRKLLVYNLTCLRNVNEDMDVFSLAGDRLPEPWKSRIIAEACPPTPVAAAGATTDEELTIPFKSFFSETTVSLSLSA